MLRISTGKYKNKRLKSANNIRPVRERIKLAVFSILGDQIINAKCLDLFAGTGLLGFEALSRGAKCITLIDNNFDSIKILNANKDSLRDLEAFEKIAVIKDDVTKHIVNDDEHYDIVFLDPPYNQHIRHIIKYVHENLTRGGLIIYFHSAKDSEDFIEQNDKLKIIDTRRYGATTVDFISRV